MFLSFESYHISQNSSSCFFFSQMTIQCMARLTSFHSITSLFCSSFMDSFLAFTHSIVVKLLTTPFYCDFSSENDPSVSFRLVQHCCNDERYNQLSNWSLLTLPPPKLFTTTVFSYLKMLI